MNCVINVCYVKISLLLFFAFSCLQGCTSMIGPLTYKSEYQDYYKKVNYHLEFKHESKIVSIKQGFRCFYEWTWNAGGGWYIKSPVKEYEFSYSIEKNGSVWAVRNPSCWSIYKKDNFKLPASIFVSRYFEVGEENSKPEIYMVGNHDNALELISHNINPKDDDHDYKESRKKTIHDYILNNPTYFMTAYVARLDELPEEFRADIINILENSTKDIIGLDLRFKNDNEQHTENAVIQKSFFEALKKYRYRFNIISPTWAGFFQKHGDLKLMGNSNSNWYFDARSQPTFPILSDKETDLGGKILYEGNSFEYLRKLSPKGMHPRRRDRGVVIIFDKKNKLAIYPHVRTL